MGATGSEERGGVGAFGRRLKEERLRLELTQTDLARMTGVSNVTISRLENGASQYPDAHTVRELARALGVEPAALLEDHDDGPSSEILAGVNAFTGTEEARKLGLTGPELAWLRGRPAAFWQGLSASPDTLELLVRAHRKSRG